MIEILQTLGICIGSLALVVIAFTLFLLYARIDSLFAPPIWNTDEDENLYDDADAFEEDNVLVVMPKRGGRKRGKRK